MAVPARENAADEEQDGTCARKHAAGWASVQVAMMTSAESCALACAELARSPHHGAAMAMVQLTRGVLERLGDVARRNAFSDEVLEAERAAAFAAGVASVKAARKAWPLELIRGGQDG
jgi:RES domain-containing protein